MKKREYEAPEIELLKFNTEDCMTVSGGVKGDDPIEAGKLP